MTLIRLFLLNIFLFISYSTGYSQWKSYKIYNNDTINRIDLRGYKQGLWIYFNDNYKNKIVQKGYYKDGLKQGTWEIYYPNGKLKAKITFKNNRQFGPATTYYPNGNIKEQGVWKANRWVGEYKYFYDNGNPKYIWHYDNNGKRNGEQKYFYENGNLMLVGTWREGLETGTLKEYYPNGKIKKISNWTNGKLNGESLEYYPDGQPKTKRFFVNGQEDINRRILYARKKEETNKQKDTQTHIQIYRQFTGTGNFKFYNNEGKISSEGYFKDGYLYNGKKYVYNKDGELTKIIYYKKGRVVRTESIK